MTPILAFTKWQRNLFAGSSAGHRNRACWHTFTGSHRNTLILFDRTTLLWSHA